MKKHNTNSQDDDRSNPQKITPKKEEQHGDRKFKNNPPKDPKDADYDSEGRPNNPFV